MIRVELTIHGKVQGVFFRAHALRKAAELGDINGWVANESDGTVRIVAEGPENNMNLFVDFCSSGPSTCEVEKVEVERLEYTGEFDGFGIRY